MPFQKYLGSYAGIDVAVLGEGLVRRFDKGININNLVCWASCKRPSGPWVCSFQLDAILDP